MRGQATLVQAAQRELDTAVSRTEPGNLNINNIQVAVWHRGAVAFTGVGNRVRQGLDDPPAVTAETLFRLASVSKPITAVGTLWQVERGGFELGRSFNGYLSELPQAMHLIQAHNILTHTSGIRHYGNKKASDNATGQQRTAREALRLFLNDPLVAPVGDIYHYSTHAYTLLAAALEVSSRRNFTELMADLFRRAGVQDMGFENPPQGGDTARIRRRAPLYGADRTLDSQRLNLSWKWAGGGMESTASDLVTFFGQVAQGRVISSTLWERMGRSNPSFPRRPRGSDPTLGLGLMLRGDFLYHSGSQEGTSTFLVINPKAQTVVAALCNTYDRDVSALCYRLERFWRDGRAS